VKIPYGASKIALTVALAGMTAQWAPAQSGVITNQTYVLSGGSGSHCYLIASLPANSLGDYDHLHLMVTTNYGWGASANASIDALFGNRNGFTYSYSLRGASVSADARLVAYMNSDSSISLYLMFANVYAVASYTVLEDVEETVYTSPSDLGSATPSGTLVFDSSSPNYPPAIFQAFGNNVGIGTTAPIRPLTINNGEMSLIPYTSNSNAYFNISDVTGSNGGNYNLIFRGLGSNGSVGVNVNSIDLMAGSVGIGTTNPVRKLEIAGDVQIDGNLYFGSNTTPQSAPYSGSCGGDYAESMDVTGDRTKYAPGDLLVLDQDNPGKILKSIEPYSTTVAGIYSTKPGPMGRRQTGPKSDSEVPMAMVGVVPAKVTAENGAIKVGDLLVSSSMSGYVMKGTDRSRMLGAVVGKAMGNLDSGTGVIEVLVTLQ